MRTLFCDIESFSPVQLAKTGVYPYAEHPDFDLLLFGYSVDGSPVEVVDLASGETLLYSPELKFYSNKVKMDTNLNTNIQGLHCLGDSSGWTRGLMMASAMGVLMGRKLLEKES